MLVPRKKTKICRYCGKRYTPQGIKSHEKNCDLNPVVQHPGAPCLDPRTCIVCQDNAKCLREADPF